MRKGIRWEYWIGALGVVLFITGSYMGLFVAPPERHMGEVQRIFYVHLPTAWNSLLFLTGAFVAAIGSLWTGKKKWDAAMVGMIEVGTVLCALLLVQGSIWARPTWGVWWDWDVRLTTTLILMLLFAGILALRSFVEDSGRRATWSAVATIVSFVDVPLVYFCVRWWRSLHQVQSSPETVSNTMILPLRLNAFGILFLAIAFVILRAKIEMAHRRHEEIEVPERRKVVVAHA